MLSLMLSYMYYTNTYYNMMNSFLISMLLLVVCTMSMFNKSYSVVTVTILMSMLMLVCNILYFYFLMEMSMVYFIYLFLYSAYKERASSVMLMVVYMLIFSLPYLVVMLSLPSTSIMIMKVTNTNIIMALLMVMVFINKMPLYGFHYWLLKAHSYCTTWGSVILASIMLKVGVLGLMYMYQVSYVMMSIMKYYLYVGICISSLNMLFMTDIKMMIAQTSVTHMTFLGVGLLLNSSMSIKLGVMFSLIHGIVSMMMFSMGEVLAVMSKSRNMMLIKKMYVISMLFMGVMLMNNSFPMSPYMWCELWIFMMMTVNAGSVSCGMMVIIMVVTCNILFFNWVVMIKHQYLIVMSDLKYTYLLMYVSPMLMLFFMMFK